MGDHQCLHGHAVLFHQVGNAGIGIDHDLVGQPHVAALVALFRAEKLLTVRPVMVVHRHPDRGIGIHHLLGADNFDLVGVGVQAVVRCDPGNLAVIALDQLEGPFRTF